jgi:alpha-L-fucosidase
MRTLFLLLFAALSLSSIAQYQPNWESIDSRPVPQWFKDAKFGIFIHWGVYSVPGWSRKGQYAEWYQQGLQTNDTARQRYHKARFGDRTYYDLANDFKAELFNPDEWAKLFEQSGAKYIVLTSKHHDGYALWPSEHASKVWGFPWNAMSVGPHRDLLGDLFKAVRKTSVHAGMYYSLYEWFNPLWKSDPKKFAAEHTWPQMKDLINKYEPDVFWTDGDWDATAETWRSQEFLAWLFNESPVKDKVVVNDRWGSGVRFRHGGIFTPEYQPDLGFEERYWEESRGMGHSYGYNREEDAWDYNSTASLVMQLVDKVSRGGNFLLDIGPDEHGKIPPIMQERLLEMGEWLKNHGNAIYGTSKWRESRQGDVYFTYNADSNNLYAIFSKYPSSKRIELNNVQLPPNTNVELLSAKQRLRWESKGRSTVIFLPEYDPNLFKTPFAYAIRIANYGKFLKKPVVNVAYKNGSLTPTISIQAGDGSVVRYTTDGNEPDENSTVYSKPFVVNNTVQLKVKAFSNNALSSGTAIERVVKYEWLSAVKASSVKAGIAYKYYEPSGKIDMKVFESGIVARTGIASVVSHNEKQRTDKFALLFEGFIKIDKDGAYEFFTSSDDGSKLFIDELEIVDNDGDHGTVEKSGKAFLRKGLHKIKVQYFDSGGGNELRVHIQPEGGRKVEVPASILFH